jgi:hypothetical protein
MTWRTERSVAAGAAGGLVAGLVSGVLLQLVHMTTMEGVRQPAMGLVAGAVHTAWAPLAWAGYVVYATLIGAAFGWLLRWQHVGAGSGVVWGVLYGGFWWIVSGLVVIPALYGVAPMIPAAVAVIRNASMPWFAAMLLDGAVLGAAYVLFLHERAANARDEALKTPRAA